MNMPINETEKLKLFHKICQKCNLGSLKSSPAALTGGFMHKMYSLFTDQGKYAVKLLNPFVMQRKTVWDNYQAAEALELILEKNHLPIIPALICNGQKMQNIDGQLFYLYQWYAGHALKPKEISGTHCAKIGGLLAQIHKLDRKGSNVIPKELHIDWDFYITRLSKENEELYGMLNDNRVLLYESQEKGNVALAKLPPVYPFAIMIWIAKMYYGLDRIAASLIWNAFHMRAHSWSYMKSPCAGPDMKNAILITICFLFL